MLESDPQHPSDKPNTPAEHKGKGAGALAVSLLILMVLADWLFWDQYIGFSLVIFAVAVFLVSVRNIRPVKSLIDPAILLTICALPVIEYTQFLSVMFLFAGLAAAVVWGRRPDANIIIACLSMLGEVPRQWVRALIFPIWFLYSAKNSAKTNDLKVSTWRGVLRNWGLPVGGGLVFLSLLIDANPIFSEFFQYDWDLGTLINRAIFWFGIAILIWPFLDVQTAVRHRKPLNWRVLTFGANPQSVLRSLWVFNALIGVQTIMDMSILIGGASLPDGMSFAEYAHRGAYPLVLTALLAGGFALIANPFLAEHRSIKPLMYLWLAQNIALCVSALLRLDLYIDSYGLTYMRVYALIWMVLVAVGLGLTAWQIQRGHGVRWLLKRAVLMGVTTLYLCCFVNFAHVIAVYNIARGKVDEYSFCNFSNTASGAFIGAGLETYTYGPMIEGWRDWGFREWRVREYVAAQLERSTDDPNSDR